MPINWDLIEKNKKEYTPEEFNVLGYKDIEPAPKFDIDFTPKEYTKEEFEKLGYKDIDIPTFPQETGYTPTHPIRPTQTLPTPPEQEYAFPEAPEERGAIGAGWAGIVRGTVGIPSQVLGGGAKWLGSIFGSEEMQKQGAEIQKEYEDWLTRHPEYQPTKKEQRREGLEYVAGTIAESAPFSVGTFAAGGGIGGIAKAAGLGIKAAQIIGAGTKAFPFGLSAAGQISEQAKAEGVSEDKANLYGFIAAIGEIGLEYWGANQLLKAMGLKNLTVKSLEKGILNLRSLKPIAAQTGRTMAVEALEEMAQQVKDNILVKEWNPEWDIFSGVGISGLAGAVMGGAMGGSASMANKAFLDLKLNNFTREAAEFKTIDDFGKHYEDMDPRRQADIGELLKAYGYARDYGFSFRGEEKTAVVPDLERFYNDAVAARGQQLKDKGITPEKEPTPEPVPTPTPPADRPIDIVKPTPEAGIPGPIPTQPPINITETPADKEKKKLTERDDFIQKMQQEGRNLWELTPTELNIITGAQNKTNAALEGLKVIQATHAQSLEDNKNIPNFQFYADMETNALLNEWAHGIITEGKEGKYEYDEGYWIGRYGAHKLTGIEDAEANKWMQDYIENKGQLPPEMLTDTNPVFNDIKLQYRKANQPKRYMINVESVEGYQVKTVPQEELDRLSNEGIFESDNIGAVKGLTDHQEGIIYLPEGATPEEEFYTKLHEKQHIISETDPDTTEAQGKEVLSAVEFGISRQDEGMPFTEEELTDEGIHRETIDQLRPLIESGKYTKLELQQEAYATEYALREYEQRGGDISKLFGKEKTLWGQTFNKVMDEYEKLPEEERQGYIEDFARKVGDKLRTMELSPEEVDHFGTDFLNKATNGEFTDEEINKPLGTLLNEFVYGKPEIKPAEEVLPAEPEKPVKIKPKLSREEINTKKISLISNNILKNFKPDEDIVKDFFDSDEAAYKNYLKEQIINELRSPEYYTQDALFSKLANATIGEDFDYTLLNSIYPGVFKKASKGKKGDLDEVVDGILRNEESRNLVAGTDITDTSSAFEWLVSVYPKIRSTRVKVEQAFEKIKENESAMYQKYLQEQRLGEKLAEGEEKVPEWVTEESGKKELPKGKRLRIIKEGEEHGRPTEGTGQAGEAGRGVPEEPRLARPVEGIGPAGALPTGATGRGARGRGFGNIGAPAKQGEGAGGPGTVIEPVGAGITGQRRTDWRSFLQPTQRIVIPPTQVNIYQVEYKSKSKSPNIAKILLPSNMATAYYQALDSVEKAKGNIDEYVKNFYKFNNTESLLQALAPHQIDGLALIAYNIETKGLNGATIIADMTGTGKGRMAGTVIALAFKEGKIPIFFTAKPGLFTDFHRDLTDIGMGNLRPLVIHATTGVYDSEGREVYPPALRPAKNEKMQERIDYLMNNWAELSKKYDYIIAPYSQIRNPGAAQRELIAMLAKDNVIVMDESHEASGSESQTNRYMTDIVTDAKQLTYLSATFAKRPEHLPIYIRTSLGKANMNIYSLIGIIERGGVPLQELISNALASGGELIRREMDFSNVKYITYYDTENKDAHGEILDSALGAIDALVNYDHEVKEYIFKLRKRLHRQYPQYKVRIKQPSNIFGLKENWVKQIYLAIKSIPLADNAIEFLFCSSWLSLRVKK